MEFDPWPFQQIAASRGILNPLRQPVRQLELATANGMESAEGELARRYFAEVKAQKTRAADPLS